MEIRGFHPFKDASMPYIILSVQTVPVTDYICRVTARLHQSYQDMESALLAHETTIRPLAPHVLLIPVAQKLPVLSRLIAAAEASELAYHLLYVPGDLEWVTHTPGQDQ